jgi:hypothetical protein
MVEESGEERGPGHVQSENTGDAGEGESYSVEEAARVLGRTPGRVRQMLRAGELAGEHEDGDPARPWRVPKWAVHAMKDEAKRRAQEDARTPRDPAESTAALSRRVQELLRELGRMEGRLELTATTESTLRETLERERQRADEERRRADAERERAEEIRRELEEMRSRGFWRRLFGG